MAVVALRSRKEYDDLIQKGISLVDFNAPWCNPCRFQEPILERVAMAFDGRAAVAAMNIDNHQDMVLNLGIQSIPTLVIFKNNKEIQRFIGLQPESVIAGALNSLVE